MDTASRIINVVIIGGSAAGRAAGLGAAQLVHRGFPNVRVALIEQNSHYYHALGTPRALVDSAFAKGLFLPYTGLFDKCTAKGSQHRVVHGTVTAVRDNAAILSDGQTLAFDYLVLATGSRIPGGLAKCAWKTRSEGLESLAKMRAEISKSRSMLIVGGGPIGVELAGEVAHAYRTKAIRLVHSGPRLLPQCTGCTSEHAHAKLKALGVDVVLDEAVNANVRLNTHVPGGITVRAKSGARFACDLVVYAGGVVPNSECLGESRAIRVRGSMQTVGQPHIFAPGDVNDLPRRAKFYYKAAAQGRVAAENIARLVGAGFDIEYKRDRARALEVAECVRMKYWVDAFHVCVVPIGPRGGVTQIGAYTVPDCVGDLLTRKIKGEDYLLRYV